MFCFVFGLPVSTGLSSLVSSRSSDSTCAPQRTNYKYCHTWKWTSSVGSLHIVHIILPRSTRWQKFEHKNKIQAQYVEILLVLSADVLQTLSECEPFFQSCELIIAHHLLSKTSFLTRIMTISSPLPSKILILGGYGNTGRALVPLLLKHTIASIVISGRNREKAIAFAKELGQEHETRVSTAQVDASDSQSLLEAFSSDGVTLVIVVSTTSKYVEKVAQAALDAKIDYMDIHLSSPHKTEFLESLKEKITQAGLCFVTDGGFHPGLPAAMVRYLALSFAQLETALVGSVIQMDWNSCQDNMSANAAEEFASEFGDMQAIVYKDSKWHDLGLMGMMAAKPLYMNFGEPFGSRPLLPMHLEEMRCIPTIFPSVKATGFYVGGFNFVTDYLISPLVIISVKLFPASKRIMGQLLYWSLRTFSKPPFATILKAEATGLNDKGDRMEKTLLLAHEDGYAVTAIPVAATVMQYLSPSTTGSIRKPGLWRQAAVVEPRQFFQDLEMMGVRIEPPVA